MATANEPLNVKVGDTVLRFIGSREVQPMSLKVTKVGTTSFECGPWEFCIMTGAEIDEALGWGPKTGATGSWVELPQ